MKRETQECEKNPTSFLRSMDSESAGRVVGEFAGFEEKNEEADFNFPKIVAALDTEVVDVVLASIKCSVDDILVAEAALES